MNGAVEGRREQDDLGVLRLIGAVLPEGFNGEMLILGLDQAMVVVMVVHEGSGEEVGLLGGGGRGGKIVEVIHEVPGINDGGG